MPIQWDDETLGAPQKQPVYDGIIWDDDIGIGDASKERGTLGELAAGLGRGALRVVATPAYLADVAGEAVGWEGLERVGESGAEKVEKFIEESPSLRKSASISGDIRDNPQLWTDPRWYSSLVGEGAPTIASMIIPGMAAAKVAKVAGWGAKGIMAARTGGALTAGMGLEAGGAAEDVRQYEERTGEQVPIGKKLKTVVGTGVVAGSLEAVPIFNLFGGTVARKLIGRIITSMAFEGGTEGAQEIVANAFAKAGYDADRDMVGGVIESVVGGVLLGGGMGAMQQTFQERIKETDPDDVADVLEQAEEETPSEAATLINMIDEGMTTGEINGQPFTPEIATGIIREAYADKALTGEDLDNFREKYPDLRPVINDIIDEKVKAEINKEMEDADARGVLLGEDKDITAKELLTGKREKALTSEELITERAKVFEGTPQSSAEISAEVFEKEIIEEERVRARAEIEPLINRFMRRAKPEEAEDVTPSVWKSQDIITLADAWNKIWAAGTTVVPDDMLTKAKTMAKARPDLLALVRNIEGGVEMMTPKEAEKLLPSQGFIIKPKTKLRKPPISKPYEADVSYKPIVSKSGKPFRSMAWANRVLKSKGLSPTEYTIIEHEDGFAIQRFGRKIKPAFTEPTVEIGIEKLPEFSGSTEALTFGKDATPDQIKALKQRREVSLGKFEKLIATRDLNKASIEVTKAQLDKEAIDALEILREHPEYLKKPEKEVEITESEKDEYVYHNSSQRNLESITKEGLSKEYAEEYPHGIADVSDKLKRVYFAESPETTEGFGGSMPSGELSFAMLRVKKNVLKGKTKTQAMGVRGEETWYFGDTIAPENIEVFENGKWKPLVPAKPLPSKPKAKDNIDNLIESFEATGHTATRYPRKKQISVDGRTMNEKEAIEKMRRVVEARPSKLPKAKPPEAVREEIKGEAIPEVTPKRPKVEVGNKFYVPENKSNIEITKDYGKGTPKEDYPGTYRMDMSGWIEVKDLETGDKFPITRNDLIEIGIEKPKVEKEKVEVTPEKPKGKAREPAIDVIFAMEDFPKLTKLLPKFKSGEEFSKINEAASRWGKAPSSFSAHETDLMNDLLRNDVDSINFVKLGKMAGKDFKDKFGKDFFEFWQQGYKAEKAIFKPVIKQITGEKLEKPTGVEPLSETKSRLIENIKSEKGESILINDLSRIGADAIRRGHESFKAFSAQMKTTLSEVWDKIKHLMREAYEAAKTVLKSERGAIGGIKAIGAPTGQLTKAQEMLAEGKDKKEVWRETGWMKGAENRWKFEIDDSGAKFDWGFLAILKAATKRKVKLNTVLKHPELYKSYPMLKDIDVYWDKDLGANAAYGERTIVLNPVMAVSKEESKDLLDITRSHLLHEVQHAIQDIEGFARGGTEEQFRLKGMENIFSEESIIYKNLFNEKIEIEEYISRRWLSYEPTKITAKKDFIEKHKKDKGIAKAVEELKAIESKMEIAPKTAFDAYKRLAGEIEAREVEIRKNLTKEQRRIMPPYADEAIPEDQWIITKGEGTSFSVEETKQFATKPTKDYRAMLKKYQEAHVRKPSFQETLEPVTIEDYISNRKISRNIKLAATTNAKRVASEIVGGIDRFLGSISTRLGQVSPKLKAKLRRLDFDINTKYADSVKVVRPLLEKAKKMSRDDFADWDYARKNSDIAKIGELINKYNLQDEYIAYRKILDSLRKEGLDVGMEIGEIEEYAPRILKDDRGFLKEIGKPEYRPLYSDKLKARAEEMGITVESMPHDLKADIVSNIILGGWVGLGGIPATKHRILRKIPANLNKFYMDSDAALMQHLHSIRKAIEARKFFGKIPKKVAEMRTRLYAAQSKIRELNDQLKNELPKEESEKIRKKRNKYIGLEKQYTAYIQTYAIQRDYKENIGAYVIELIEKKEISPQHERMVNDILKARFHEVGTRGIIQAYKNLSYIDTMGSPISALTQIGDLAWAAYEGGLIRTLKYAYKSATKQSRITKEDVGVERIAQEFADAGTLGNAVSRVFKIVGLEKIDSIGKEALLNTALEKYQTRAKRKPLKLKREIRPVFEAETDSVIDDLVNNEISENVKLLVYSRLLDFQPIALSEMPQGYLDAGNGRLFYMLKTFTIKVFDVYRNEVYYKVKKGNKAEKIEGFKNLARLSFYFVLANAGADELKDWVLGRTTDFSDRLVDNILRLFGVSKFVTWKARTEGVGSALARQVLPPFKFIDSAGKDIITAGDEKGLEVIGSIPVVGKLAYWHLGRGTSKREDLWDRRLRKHKAKLNKIKDDFDKAKDKATFQNKHRKELRALRKANELQGELNEDRKRINRIKSRKETKAGKLEIQRLEKRRTDKIKNHLKKY